MHQGKRLRLAPWRLVRDRFRMGLGQRIIGLALLAVVVTGGLIGALVIDSSRATLRSDILSNNLSTAELAGKLATSFVEGAETSLRELLASPPFVTAVLEQDLEQAEWHMEQGMQIDTRFDNIAVYTAEGIGWASGLRSEWQNRGGSVADREWFKQTIVTRAPCLGIPIVSRGTGRPVVSYTIPILDDKGEMRAILVGGISLAVLADLITEAPTSEFARASLVDSRAGGIIVTDADPSRILQPVGAQDEAFSQAAAGKRGTLETRSSNGEVDLASFAPVPRLPWSVVVLEPAKTAFSPITALTKRAVLWVGVVLLVALIAGVLLARRIVNPLGRLAKGAAEVGAGNLDYRLGTTKKDEIGVVSRAFDNMTKELQTTLVSRDDLAKEVDERRRAQEALRETNEYLDNLFNYANAPIIVWDPEFRISRFNRAFEALTGRTTETVIGEPLGILFPAAQVESSMELIRKTLTGERWEAVEIPILHLDGSVSTVLWNSATLFAPDGVTPAATIAQGQNITDRKRAEDMLRASEARYESLVELSPEAIIVNVRGRFVFVNPAAARLFGARLPEEVLGKTVTDLIHPDDRQLIAERTTRALSGSVTPPQSIKVLRLSGGSVEVEATGARIEFDGEPAVQVVMRDITERKQAEKQISKALLALQRSNQDLEQFAYVASHDLQEPLRMVASYTELLAQRYQGQLDDKAQTYIHYAVDGATRMQRLINDLLTYSRVSTQGRPLEPTDSHAVLGEALRNLTVAIEENRAIVSNDDLPTVRVDASQLQQVFQNLIANAIKFRGQASPHAHVSARQEAGEWLFSVADNGIGIDAQHAPKLFVIFQRLHGRQEYPGTGIGLAVCKRIVERHGGKIWFESKPGEGSTFFFTLPK
jgi:PAS domain S-box-containing protein